MNLVKNIALALSLMVATNLMTAPKAKAGLLLSPATGGMTAVVAIGQGVLIGSTGAKFLNLIGYKDMFRLWGAGMLLIALEDEVEQTVGNIETVLSTRYPMIADQTIFADIAELVMNSENVEEFKFGVLDVKVDEAELSEILERLDTTDIEADVEQLIQDLI